MSQYAIEPILCLLSIGFAAVGDFITFHPCLASPANH